MPHLTKSCADVVVTSRSNVRMNILNQKPTTSSIALDGARACDQIGIESERRRVRTDAIACASTGSGVARSRS